MFLKLYTSIMQYCIFDWILSKIILFSLSCWSEKRSNQECIHQTPIMTISSSAELTKHLSWYLFFIPASFSYTRQMPFQSNILYIQNAPWVVENMVGNTPYLKTVSSIHVCWGTRLWDQPTSPRPKTTKLLSSTVVPQFL